MLRFLRGAAAAFSILLLCLFRAPSTGWSQASGQEAMAGADQRQYTLSGSVVNSLTGEPIRRALVSLSGTPIRSSRLEARGTSGGVQLTDDNGQFHFDGLGNGRVRISVRKPGFFDEGEPGNGNAAGQPVLALVGPGSGPLTLKLVPQAVVYGRVQNLQREPIEDIPVHLIARRIVEGRQRWEEIQGSTTNDEGEFRIANLSAGTYYLEFGPGSGTNYLRQLAGQGQGYPALFYPGVSEISAATPVELGPGQQWNNDVSLSSVPLVTITGTITGVPADGNVGVEVIDQLGNSLPVATEFDAAKGEFRSALPAGSYTLVATAWTENQGQQQAAVPLNLTSDLAGIHLALRPAQSIPVLVTIEGVRPDSRRNRFASNAVPVSVHLTAEGGFMQRGEYWAVPEGNSNPVRLVLGNLRPGKYAVEVSANDSWYVQSARAGDIDLLREDLIVADGTAMPPIEISLRDDAAAITGQVRMGKNDRGATVLVVPERGSSLHPKSFPVHEDGSFLITPLAPGNYDVLAFDRIDGLEYAIPGAVDAYLSKAVHLTLNPGERSRITIDLLKAGD